MQRGLLSVPHIVTKDIRVYGQLRGHLTLTAECLAVELSLLVLTTSICRGWGSNADVPHARLKFLSQIIGLPGGIETI